MKKEFDRFTAIDALAATIITLCLIVIGISITAGLVIVFGWFCIPLIAGIAIIYMYWYSKLRKAE